MPAPSDQQEISPDLIRSVSELLRAAGHRSCDGWLSPDMLQSVAQILGAVAWPIAFVTVIVLFRRQFEGLIRRVRKFDFAGTSLEAEEEVSSKLEASADAALSLPETQLPADVSSDDFRRAAEVETLSSKLDVEAIRSQIDQIAAEYEGIRATMPSGPARTRQIGAVMAKMRALGRAAFPLRKELLSSPSPGHRLFAIAALQIIPDLSLVDWLAESVGREVPYIQYQALNALMTAVRNAGPRAKSSLRRALAIARSHLPPDDPDTSRWNLLQTIEGELDRIPDWQHPTSGE